MNKEEFEILDELRKQNIATHKLLQCILVMQGLNKEQLNKVVKQIEKEVNNV